MKGKLKYVRFFEREPRPDPAPVPDIYPRDMVFDFHYTIEPMTPEDTALIYDSWCANQAKLLQHQEIANEIFKVEMRARVTRLLTMAKTAVARPTQTLMDEIKLPYNPKDILGWISYDFDRKTHAPVVHFVYVKQLAQQRKIAKHLLHDAAGLAPQRMWWSTHTSRGGRILREQYGGLYNPMMLEYAHELKDRDR